MVGAQARQMRKHCLIHPPHLPPDNYQYITLHSSKLLYVFHTSIPTFTNSSASSSSLPHFSSIFWLLSSLLTSHLHTCSTHQPDYCQWFLAYNSSYSFFSTPANLAQLNYSRAKFRCEVGLIQYSNHLNTRHRNDHGTI